MNVRKYFRAVYVIPVLYLFVFLIAYLLGNYTSLGECTGEGFLCLSKAFVLVVIVNAPGILIGGVLGIQNPFIIGILALCVYGVFGWTVDRIVRSLYKTS